MTVSITFIGECMMNMMPPDGRGVEGRVGSAADSFNDAAYPKKLALTQHLTRQSKRIRRCGQH